MSIFSKSNKPQEIESSAFSKFIRDASSGEKKRVYSEVLEKASEMQNDVIKRAHPSDK